MALKNSNGVSEFEIAFKYIPAWFDIYTRIYSKLCSGFNKVLEKYEESLKNVKAKNFSYFLHGEIKREYIIRLLNDARLAALASLDDKSSPLFGYDSFLFEFKLDYEEISRVREWVLNKLSGVSTSLFSITIGKVIPFFLRGLEKILGLSFTSHTFSFGYIKEVSEHKLEEFNPILDKIGEIQGKNLALASILLVLLSPLIFIFEVLKYIFRWKKLKYKVYGYVFSLAKLETKIYPRSLERVGIEFNISVTTYTIPKNKKEYIEKICKFLEEYYTTLKSIPSPEELMNEYKELIREGQGSRNINVLASFITTKLTLIYRKLYSFLEKNKEILKEIDDVKEIFEKNYLDIIKKYEEQIKDSFKKTVIGILEEEKKEEKKEEEKKEEKRETSAILEGLKRLFGIHKKKEEEKEEKKKEEEKLKIEEIKWTSTLLEALYTRGSASDFKKVEKAAKSEAERFIEEYTKTLREILRKYENL